MTAWSIEDMRSHEGRVSRVAASQPGIAVTSRCFSSGIVARRRSKDIQLKLADALRNDVCLAGGRLASAPPRQLLRVHSEVSPRTCVLAIAGGWRELAAGRQAVG